MTGWIKRSAAEEEFHIEKELIVFLRGTDRCSMFSRTSLKGEYRGFSERTLSLSRGEKQLLLERSRSLKKKRSPLGG